VSPLPRRERRTEDERDLEDRRRMIGPTLGGRSGIVAPVPRRMPAPVSRGGSGGPAIKYIQDDQPGTMKPRELWLDTDEPAPDAAPAAGAMVYAGTWVAGSYAQGSVVRLTDVVYVASAAVSGTPGTDPLWEQIGTYT
jgi:hypothetical protein